MALSDYDSIADLLVMPGRLVIAPTNAGLALAFPHGGTSLGMTESGVIFSRQENYKILTTEEGGQVPKKIIHLGEHLSLSAELVEWDDAVVAQVWKGYLTTGATSGKSNITWPGSGTYYPGLDLAGQSVILGFFPEDESSGKVVIARKAVPVGLGDMAFKASEKVILAIKFVILEDTAITVGNAKYNYRGLFAGDIQDVDI